ncbi:hypothetical protein GCM10019016_103540 [Streptomyces prasinosporus]|uniref:ATP-binding cassette domain-containing protein n=1 Tax=Streptomyces prasinosporus TaxID=68256 RepID=A0ABP6U8J2_9ACTN
MATRPQPGGRGAKGSAQKVALAQALFIPPDLLVLDEPWSGLDSSAHDVLAELIDEVAAQGGAVVFTDHRDARPLRVHPQRRPGHPARRESCPDDRAGPDRAAPGSVEVLMCSGLRGVELPDPRRSRGL